MATWKIILIACGWLASNLIFPLLVRSINRIYGSRMDAAVRGSISAFSRLTNELIRFGLIVWLSPAIVIILPLMNSGNQRVQGFLGRTQLACLVCILTRRNFSPRMLRGLFP